MSIQKPSINIVSKVDDNLTMVTLVNDKIELECVKADDSDMSFGTCVLTCEWILVAQLCSINGTNRQENIRLG